MTRPQRTKTFVDSDVQGALARRILWHWVVFVGVAGVAAFLLQVLSNPFQSPVVHLKNLWWTHGPFMVVLVFLLPVFVVDTIKLSHRFAGPICNLRRAMREIVQGQSPRKLRFRGGDFWQELAADYNAMLSKLAPGACEADAPADQEELVGTAD